MKSLQEQLKYFESYHKSRTNQFTHFIGIPAIMLALLFLLSWISVSIAGSWHISFAWLATIALLVYYFLLDIKLAAVMTVVLIVLTLICSAIAYPYPTKGTFITFIILFVGGLILQLVGHTFEKSKPPFFKSFSLVVIAPLYVVIKLLKVLNLDKHFNLTEENPSSSDSGDQSE